ncbi:choice-of-anchor J domain-containing protein [Prevotella dentasini]|uniref:choice-of-anchor J domain-containing protein n=1 Tax=Prevotella dentasini TaxID=589537 RepID=UPI00046A4658|nr:choice-of-anchor J domain-containing protein [Prevotella dentasini]
MGRKAGRTVFVGEDIPTGPDAILIDGQTNVTLEWSPITKGKNGGYVNPDNVKYAVATIVSNNVGEVLAEGLSDTSYEIEYNTDEGEQKMLQYAVNAIGTAGESGYYVSEGLLVGKPDELPFNESVKGYFFEHLTWWVSSSNPDNTFKLSKNSSDDDNGSLTWKANAAGEWSSINSGKINSKSGNPNFSLLYDYWAVPGKDVKLDIIVQKANGTEEVARTIDFKNLTGNEEWRTDMVSFSKYTNERYIIVKFRYTSNEIGTELFIDNIKIQNMYNSNLEVKLKAPKKANAGIPAEVKAIVMNSGKMPVNSCQLEIKVDGKPFKQENIVEGLNSMESREFALSIPVPSDKTGKMTVEATILGTDENPADNTASKEISIEESNLPKPENLKAESLGGGAVKLTWDAPANNVEKVTEDFAAYEPWIIEGMGDWTLIDGDKLTTFSIFNGVEWPHIGDPQSFITYNLANIGIDVSAVDPDYLPHSGEQCLLSINGKGENDNWLISPALSGNMQTVRFWATSLSNEYPETFEVLYSMGGKTVSEFRQVKEYAGVLKGWKQFEIAIPEGARYFAIRLKSNDKLGLLLDDVEFERGTAVPVGYNLYRDDAFVKNVGRNQLYTHDSVGSAGEHTYALTAVYPEGESAPVQATVVTAITDVNAAAGQTYTVYTVDGKLIGKNLKSLKKLAKGVYIVNEKKITIK